LVGGEERSADHPQPPVTVSLCVEEVERMFELILLSVDGSPDSDKALGLTRDLARIHGSRVLVVHGRDVPFVAPSGQPAPPRVERWESDEDARQLIDAAVSELQAAGVDVRGEVLPGQGRISYKILETAERESADLIVLGSRGMSRVEELMIGSVSHKIIHMAKCPVLLAR
jgi:nucleotide-binding universal stress UspA family protein